MALRPIRFRCAGRASANEVEMVRRYFPISLLFLALMMAGDGHTALSGADRDEEKKLPPRTPIFQDDIRPILDAKCIRCHAGKAPKGDLDLSTPAGALKGGESG